MSRLAKTAVAVCLFVLCSQAAPSSASFPNESTFSQVQEDGPVQMQVQTLDLENKTVKLVIQNSSAQQASFDKTTVLEREQNGVWYAMQDERSVESIGHFCWMPAKRPITLIRGSSPCPRAHTGWSNRFTCRRGK